MTGIDRAMELLSRLWPQVRAELPRSEDTELVRLVGAYSNAVLPQDMDHAALAITRLLFRSLPRDHPIPVALAVDTPRFSGGWSIRSADLRLAEDFRALLDPHGRPPTAAEVAAAAGAWLLAVDAFGDDDVVRPPRELIRLVTPDGVGRWPAFQFDPDRRPLRSVLTINRILDAEDDPWGVADWWLGPNTWLPEPPADLLHRIDLAVLIEVAESERAES
jgi:hypothetical protein